MQRARHVFLVVLASIHVKNALQDNIVAQATKLISVSSVALVSGPSQKARAASLVVLEKQGHHAHHAWQESFVLAVMTTLPYAKLVRKVSTNLWVDKEAASPAFLESTTTNRTGQSASLVPKTSTPTPQSKRPAIVVTWVKSH